MFVPLSVIFLTRSVGLPVVEVGVGFDDRRARRAGGDAARGDARRSPRSTSGRCRGLRRLRARVCRLHPRRLLRELPRRRLRAADRRPGRGLRAHPRRAFAAEGSGRLRLIAYERSLRNLGYGLGGLGERRAPQRQPRRLRHDPAARRAQLPRRRTHPAAPAPRARARQDAERRRLPTCAGRPRVRLARAPDRGVVAQRLAAQDRAAALDRAPDRRLPGAGRDLLRPQHRPRRCLPGAHEPRLDRCARRLPRLRGRGRRPRARLRALRRRRRARRRRLARLPDRGGGGAHPRRALRLGGAVGRLDRARA